MRRLWKKDPETAELEARLRSDRPAPDEDLVSRLAADVPDSAPQARPRPRPNIRFGLVGVITCAALGTAAVASGTVSPVVSLNHVVKVASSSSEKEKDKPAKNQYGDKVTICHRAKKGEKGITLTLSRQGAEEHIKHHKYDTYGPCPRGRD